MKGALIRTIGYAVSETENGIQTVAFAESGEPPGPYLILSRADVATEEERAQGDDRIYLEIDDQIRAAYNAIESITIAPSRITLIIRPEAQAKIRAAQIDLILTIDETLEVEIANALFAMSAAANTPVKGRST